MILELQHRRPDGDVDTYHLKPGRRYHLGRGSNCEVRILDLKLSRKHAAIEFLDGGWKLIDLCSTNGCRLDGEVMVGTLPLTNGSQVEIGQTTLVVQRIGESGGAQPKAPSSGYQSDEFSPQESAKGEEPHKALAQREQTPPAPVYKADKYASSESFRPANIPEGDDPRRAVAITPVSPVPVLPDPSRAVAVLPDPSRAVPVLPDSSRAVPVLPDSPAAARAPAAARRSAPIKPVTLQADPSLSLEDTVATVMPSAPPPFVKPAAPTPLPAAQSAQAPTSLATATPAPGVDERTYFITVLGKRVGPLSRAVARDLKARELKGTLRPGDLDAYPAA